MDEAGACEVRARDETHEGAQARSSQGAGEEETRHIGFEVVIEHRGTSNYLDIGA